MCSRKTKLYKKEKKAEMQQAEKSASATKKPRMFERLMDFAFNRAPLRFSFKKMMIGLGYFMVGAIASFGFAPIYWLAGSFAAMLFFAYKIMHAESKKEAAKIGMWFGLGYFFAGLMWIMGVFFINASTAAKVGFFAPFAVLGLAAYCALYFMFPALLSGYFSKGVPEEDLKNVFNPFFTSKENGTGLGLALSYQYAQENNISIKINSKFGYWTKTDLVFGGGDKASGKNINSR